MYYQMSNPWYKSVETLNSDIFFPLQNGADEVRLHVKINEKAEGKDRQISWNPTTIPWDPTTIPWNPNPWCTRCCYPYVDCSSYPYCTCVPKPWDDRTAKKERTMKIKPNTHM